MALHDHCHNFTSSPGQHEDNIAPASSRALKARPSFKSTSLSTAMGTTKVHVVPHTPAQTTL